MDFKKVTARALLLALAVVVQPASGEAHRGRVGHHLTRSMPRDHAVTAPPSLRTPSSASHAYDGSALGNLEPILRPPTFAISPRTYGGTYGPSYFDRTMDTGPAKRGLAYNVRRRL